MWPTTILSDWFRNMAALEFDDPNNDLAQAIESAFAFSERATPRQLDAVAGLCADRTNILAGDSDP